MPPPPGFEPGWRAAVRRTARVPLVRWRARRMLAEEERTRRARVDRSVAQLVPRQVRAAAIAAAPVLLVCCLRNERLRLPAFLAHYRALGVGHFLVIDNQSTDGVADWLAGEPDCSCWLADGSYKASNFGMDWCNHLLASHAVGKWAVTVDPDEFLVYPHCDERPLPALARFLDQVEAPSLYAPMVDAYGGGRLSTTVLAPGESPFVACPWFDRFNFTQRLDPPRGSWWLQGGARLRHFEPDTPHKAPAVNKVPFVRWQAGLHYVSSMHHLNVPRFNCTVLDNPLVPSGVLFHFKYVNLMLEKAAEELVRREHYADSREYRAYADAGDPLLFDPEVSVRYAGPSQLVDLGFMQAGAWY